MKIKCPGCGSLLQIPETAAGKVVKCKCGKQLRAPAAKAGSAAAKPAAPAANPAAAKPAARPAAAAKPVAKRPAAPRPPATQPPAAAPPAADLFDDLTETDLGSVKAVHTPGLTNPYQAAAATGGSGHYMNDANAEGADALGPRPIPLILIAIPNILSTLAWGAASVLILGMLGLFAAAASASTAEGGEEQAAGAAAAFVAVGAVILIPLVIATLLSLACAVSCFVRGKLPWYILLFSYAMTVVMNVMSMVRSAMDGEWGAFGGGVFFSIFAIAILVYLHMKPPRLFYAGPSLQVKSAITHDVLGAILGGCLGFILFFFGRM